MSRPECPSLLVATALALVVNTMPSPSVATRAAANTSSDTCINGWREVALPDTLQDSQPMGVASIGGAPGWIATSPVAVPAEQGPGSAAWSTDRWTQVAMPWSKFGVVTGISAPSTTSAWAVGALDDNAPRPITAHWDGVSWRAKTVTRPAGQMATLAGVAATAAGDVWAVGARINNGRLIPWAIHQEVGSWRHRSPSLSAPSEGALTAVAFADTIPWAVGWRTKGGQPSPWIVRRKGSRWITVSHGLGAIGRAILTDVAFQSASQGWAVGFRERSAGGHEPLLLNWNGSTWSRAALPWSATDSIVPRAVAVDGSGHLAVAGARLAQLEPSAVMATRDESGWQTLDWPSPGYPGTWIDDVTAQTEGFMAAAWLAGRGTSLITCRPTEDPTGTPTERARDRTAIVTDWEHPESLAMDQLPTPSANLPPETAGNVVAVDITEEVGLAMTTRTFSGIIEDFNEDGRQDIFVNRHLDGPVVMFGTESGYQDSEMVFEPSDRHGCAAADVDGSGRLDLLCATGRGRGTQLRTPELILDVTDGTGLDSLAYGLVDASGRGQNVAFINLDGDERPDVYMTMKARRLDALPSLNRLYRNADGSAYDPVIGVGVDRSIGGDCLVAEDLDADGDDELLVCATERQGNRSPGIRVYVNNDGSFVESSAELGLVPVTDRDIEVADFNADGQLDVAQLTSKRLRVSLAQPGGGFAPSFEAALSSGYAMAVGDVNADGLPDIYIARRTSTNSVHLMLLNGSAATTFTPMEIPQAGAGSADDVLAFDHDGNGLTDFLVFNGRAVAGPLKLIAFYESP